MRLRRQIKYNARRALAGAWGKSITVLFILALIVALFSQFEALIYQIIALVGVESPILGIFTLGGVSIEISALSLIVTSLGAIFGIFLLIPLLMGMFRWYYQLSGGVQEDVTAVFFYFSSVHQLFRCWLLALIRIGLGMIWTAVFLAPGLMTTLLSLDLSIEARDSLDHVASMFGFVVGLALFAVGLVGLGIFLQRYKLAACLFITDPKRPILRCIHLSVRETRGQRGDLWRFALSFLPWFALCLLALPILFVLPYFLESNALYTRYLIERYERRRRAQGDTQVFQAVSFPEDAGPVLDPGVDGLSS